MKDVPLPLDDHAFEEIAPIRIMRDAFQVSANDRETEQLVIADPWQDLENCFDDLDGGNLLDFPPGFHSKGAPLLLALIILLPIIHSKVNKFRRGRCGVQGSRSLG